MQVKVGTFLHGYNSFSTASSEFWKEGFLFASAMFITVILGDSEDPPGYLQVNVNPDCPIRMIYDFIRETFDIPPQIELDLCDDAGNLVSIYDKDPWENGNNFLVVRTLYFVVLFDRGEHGKLINPILNLPPEFLSSNGQLSEMRQNINKQMNPGSAQRVGRLSRTRSATKLNPNLGDLVSKNEIVIFHNLKSIAQGFQNPTGIIYCL